MSYAEIYRRRNAPWKKLLRGCAVCLFLGVLFYFSLQLLNSQAGLMMGGAAH